jgi:hypothetical protein
MAPDFFYMDNERTGALCTFCIRGVDHIDYTDDKGLPKRYDRLEAQEDYLKFLRELTDKQSIKDILETISTTEPSILD